MKCFCELGVAVFIANSQHLYNHMGIRRCFLDLLNEPTLTHCLATSPRRTSPSGRGLCGLFKASMTMSTIWRTTGALSTSVYSSITKKRFMTSQPVRRYSERKVNTSIARHYWLKTCPSRPSDRQERQAALFVLCQSQIDEGDLRQKYQPKSHLSKASWERSLKALKLWNQAFDSALISL